MCVIAYGIEAPQTRNDDENISTRTETVDAFFMFSWAHTKSDYICKTCKYLLQATVRVLRTYKTMAKEMGWNRDASTKLYLSWKYVYVFVFAWFRFNIHNKSVYFNWIQRNIWLLNILHGRRHTHTPLFTFGFDGRWASQMNHTIFSQPNLSLNRKHSILYSISIEKKVLSSNLAQSHIHTHTLKLRPLYQ